MKRTTTVTPSPVPGTPEPFVGQLRAKHKEIYMLIETFLPQGQCFACHNLRHHSTLCGWHPTMQAAVSDSVPFYGTVILEQTP